MHFPIRTVTCGLVLFVGLATTASAQGNSWKKEAKSFQKELNAHYRDPGHSPLDSMDRIHFKALEYFPIAKEFAVPARFVRTPDEQPFEMATVSGKTKTFVQYGILYFALNGRADTLYAYQNLKQAASADYDHTLFIPFKDHASGEEAYGGGRYIDWKIPASENTTLNFNLCYNPYCAYSTGWSCPIPPKENYVDAKVLAGVKAWKHGH